MGQHVPGRRGRRRLAPLLVLVQVARLDPHARASRRSCRSTSRRRSTSSGLRPHLRARRRRGVGDLGRRPARVDGPPRRRHESTSATCSSAASASSTSRAYPDWPGLDDFDGPKFHTSRWEHQHDLTGKVVAVVGTGSTATQIVPAIQPDRRAPLRVPARAGLGHAQGRARLHPRGAADVLPTPGGGGRSGSRLKWLLEKNIWGGKIFRPDTKQNAARTPVLPRLHRPGASRTAPTCARRSRPTYPYPGKRPIFAIDVLRRAQGAQRRARPAGGRVGDAARASSTSTAWSARSTSS